MSTYRENYHLAAERLAQAGVADAEYDARQLLLFVSGMTLTNYLLRQDAEVPEDEEMRYVNLIERRAARIPLQHLTGVQCFYGLDIQVNHDVLIPRPETELLVEETLKICDLLLRHGGNAGDARAMQKEVQGLPEASGAERTLPEAAGTAQDLPQGSRIAQDCSQAREAEQGLPRAWESVQEAACVVGTAVKTLTLQESATKVRTLPKAADSRTDGAEQANAEPLEILDMCTGSGCILIALLHELDDRNINGTTCENSGIESRDHSDEFASPGGRSGYCNNESRNRFRSCGNESDKSDRESENSVKGSGTGSHESEIGKDKSENSGDGSGEIMMPGPADDLVCGTGADLSEQALRQAAENAHRLGIPKAGQKLCWIRSDMFAQVTGRFDVIVSNPPYIRSAEIEMLSPEVREHDPRMALDGGADGLSFYRILAAESPAYLKPGGRLILEIGFDQAKAVKELLEAAGFCEVSVKQDLNGLDRVIIGKIPL